MNLMGREHVVCLKGPLIFPLSHKLKTMIPVETRFADISLPSLGDMNPAEAMTTATATLENTAKHLKTAVQSQNSAAVISTPAQPRAGS